MNLRNTNFRWKALAAFAAVVPVVAITTMTAQAQTTSGLKASPLANRLEARPLSGLSLDDVSYVFLADSTASSVSFYLDGSTLPLSTDSTAPFDLNGTDATGKAVGFDTRAWTNGKHSLSAVAKTSVGDKRYSANFSVFNRGNTSSSPTTKKPSTSSTTTKPVTSTSQVPATTVPATTQKPTTTIASTTTSSSKWGCLSFSQKYPGANAMPTVSVPADFPNASNTGLNGIGKDKCSLPTYTGPSTITEDGAVIDGWHILGDLTIEASNVVIKNSWIDLGSVTAGLYSGSPDPSWSFTIQDSLVDAGYTDQVAVAENNVTVLRSEIKGGITSVHCGNNCTVKDSFLHGQMIGAKDPWHLGGFHTNGGSNYTLTHNSIFCEVPANSVGEGCSGDVVLNSTFGPTSHAKVTNNFMGAGLGLAFCTYTGTNTNSYVVYSGNVFARGTNGKCGAYGPVSDWANATGNSWSNNTWDDGSVVNP